MATRIGKVIYAKINGQNYRCKHDAQWGSGGVNSEAMAADGLAYVGTSEEPVTGTFSFTLLDANDLDITELRDLRDMQIFMIHDTGSIYLGGQANWSEPPEVQNGEVSCQGFFKPPKKII